jgi:extracellular factor (EF) 3-hydroxypalmitic acid methyl ester biosynthesis protein
MSPLHRKSRPAIPWENRGATHSDLLGGSTSLRFRSRRISSADLTFAVTCSFYIDGRRFGPVRALDLSPTGIAIEPAAGEMLAPGSGVDQLELYYRDSVLWRGTGQAIYQVNGPSARIGLRFTSGLLDLQSLQLSDGFVENRLTSLLQQNRRFNKVLPSDWRASVAVVRRLLFEVKELLEEAESLLSDNPEVRLREEKELFKKIFERWGPRYHSLLGRLHRDSLAFDPEASAIAKAYATRELLPLVYPCPMHSRCYEKPLGYAGDYRMMLLMLADGYEGDTLYGRFLHHVSKNYTFGKVVPTREKCLREKVHEAIGAKRPTRIVSLACGPAVEVQRVLHEIERVEAPLELTLIDQDEQTLQYCHEAVSREIVTRPASDSSLIRLNCLHVSVKQIIKPANETERKFIASNLQGVDLIYSAGLLDYLPDPIARRLVKRLYELLRPGGKLFIANLQECPDTSWMMEHTLAWHLEYRSSATRLVTACSSK